MLNTRKKFYSNRLPKSHGINYRQAMKMIRPSVHRQLLEAELLAEDDGHDQGPGWLPLYDHGSTE